MRRALLLLALSLPLLAHAAECIHDWRRTGVGSASCTDEKGRHYVCTVTHYKCSKCGAKTDEYY